MHNNKIIIANQKPAIRLGFNIEVTNPLGYNVLVDFYIQKKGCNESIEILDKKSLRSIKKFCERWAKRENEKINSPFLIYNETVKAINKSTILDKIFTDSDGGY